MKVSKVNLGTLLLKPAFLALRKKIQMAQPLIDLDCMGTAFSNSQIRIRKSRIINESALKVLKDKTITSRYPSWPIGLINYCGVVNKRNLQQVIWFLVHSSKVKIEVLNWVQ
jgi:hypothetical protein